MKAVEYIKSRQHPNDGWSGNPCECGACKIGRWALAFAHDFEIYRDWTRGQHTGADGSELLSKASMRLVADIDDDHGG